MCFACKKAVGGHWWWGSFIGHWRSHDGFRCKRRRRRVSSELRRIGFPRKKKLFLFLFLSLRPFFFFYLVANNFNRDSALEANLQVITELKGVLPPLPCFHHLLLFFFRRRRRQKRSDFSFDFSVPLFLDVCWRKLLRKKHRSFLSLSLSFSFCLSLSLFISFSFFFSFSTPPPRV